METDTLHTIIPVNGHASPNALPYIPDELIERCKSGDLQAYEDLYHRSKTWLYSLAYRFHGNRPDAEDSLQDTFVHLYRNIARFRGESKFTTWMYRVTINACISRQRKRKSFEWPTDFLDEATHPFSEGSSEDFLLAEFLEREISRLPELQRAVFLLYASEGLTHPEIAEALDIRVGTSKSYYHRAREVLKKHLRDEGIINESERP